MSVKEKLLARKKKMALMSRKEKRFQKRMVKLDNELKELEAEESVTTVLKLVIITFSYCVCTSHKSSRHL